MTWLRAISSVLRTKNRSDDGSKSRLITVLAEVKTHHRCWQEGKAAAVNCRKLSGLLARARARSKPSDGAPGQY